MRVAPQGYQPQGGGKGGGGGGGQMPIQQTPIQQAPVPQDKYHAQLQQAGMTGSYSTPVRLPSANIDYGRPMNPVQNTYGQPKNQVNLTNQFTKPSEYDGLRSVPNTDYYYGDGKMYQKSNSSGGKGAPSGLTQFGGQNFVPVQDANVSGFNRLGNDGNVTYQPSKAMGASLNQGTYQPQNIQSVTNFIQPPQQNLTGYGAGRFMPYQGGGRPAPMGGSVSGGKGGGGGSPAPTAGGKG